MATTTKRTFSPVKKGQLPYLNRWWLFLLTAAVNVAIIFILNWGNTFYIQDVLTDTALCGIISSFITVPVVAVWIKRMRREGTVPSDVPLSVFLQKMPKQPALLAFLFAVVFGVVTPLASWILMNAYQIAFLPFYQMVGIKLVYSLVLCSFISRFAVMRYIQPDCATDQDAPYQKGTDTVKNPMPRISYFGNLFNDVKAQAGFGLMMGLIFGGTTFNADRVMLVAPTTLSGIAITGCISAIIVSAFFIPPLCKELWGLRERGEIPVAQERNKWVAWLPANRWLFGLLLIIPMAIEMSVAYWAVLSFMQFEVLNYFQFLFIIILHNTLLFKALVPLIILRSIQPDKTKLEEAPET